MKKILVFTLLFVFYLIMNKVLAQYIPPTDSNVIENLNNWKGQKFGLMMHWGLYSQWGIVESWTLCSEDSIWCKRTGPYSANYEDYKRAYENLKTSFYPEHFVPGKFVTAAKYAGMKYVVFTTKHLDGFCMFDTKTTNYRITDVNCPFHTNPMCNISKEIFKSFRDGGFSIGAYFSKPDWNSDYYWWRYFSTPDRNVNYNPQKYPDRWNNFKTFTFNQIKELVSEYGKLDILWLDGGWVRPGGSNQYIQDINMPVIASMARNYQAGLIIVDRGTRNEYENYLSYEYDEPTWGNDHQNPWEVCMPIGNYWSYVPGDQYRSANELVQTLIKVVANGGNLLLNVGIRPDGEWDTAAYSRLNEIGKWMEINKESIYGTTALKPYVTGKLGFTSKKGNEIFVYYLKDINENIMPSEISFMSFKREIESVKLLGYNDNLEFYTENNYLKIRIPSSVRYNPPCNYSWVFKITQKNLKN